MAGSELQQPTLADFDLLVEISQMLTELDHHRLLERVIELTARRLGAERTSLLLHPEYDEHWNFIFLKHRASDGLIEEVNHDQSLHFARRVLDRGLAGWVVRKKQAAYISDTHTDERWQEFPDGTSGARSALCAPFMHNGEVMAVVTLLHSQPNYFDDHALRLVTIVANQTSIAIRNAQLFHHLQKQQKQLEAVLHAMPDLLLVLDESGRILLLNQLAAQMLDSAADPDAVLGTDLRDYLHLDSTFGLIYEIVAGTLRSGQSWSFEARSEQRRQDLLVTVSVWEAPAGGMAGYVVVMRDITMLRDLNRFKDEMLQMASHDLRSPLALIVGYCSLIEMDTPDPESPVHEYLTVIKRSTERMKGLLEDLLRVEQIRNSPLEMHQQVDFRELVSAVLNNMRPLLDEKQQALETKLQLDGLPGVMINPVLIRESMENLLSNAVKYTPEKGRIRVQAFEQGGRLHFVVEDTGVGIPRAHLPRVFESFFRAKQRGTEKVEGRGLGLSLVKTIIERHNGEVWVESEEGVGSRFGFWLPA